MRNGSKSFAGVLPLDGAVYVEECAPRNSQLFGFFSSDGCPHMHSPLTTAYRPGGELQPPGDQRSNPYSNTMQSMKTDSREHPQRQSLQGCGGRLLTWTTLPLWT